MPSRPATTRSLGKAVFGVVLIVVILFMPDGVLGWFVARRKARGSRTLARRADAGSRAVRRDRARRRGNRCSSRAACASAFSGVQALDGVDLEVREARSSALLGPNGSGKSTFINLVSGHYRPDAGSIRFAGEDIAGARRAPHRARRHRPHLPDPASVRAPDRARQRRAAGDVRRGGARPRARRAPRRIAGSSSPASSAYAGALPEDLNLHQRKFLELARALASRPRLLLLDEVLSGLTPGEINDAVDLIRAIRDDGATIVFVEHVMRAVMALSDRLVVLDHGVVHRRRALRRR